MKSAPKMPLTKIEWDRAACPVDRPAVRLADEKGMYLEVSKRPTSTLLTVKTLMD